MNEIVGIVGIGIIGVFAVWGSVKSFIMVDDIIVIFNGFDYHLHNVIGSDLWSFVILVLLSVVNLFVDVSVVVSIGLRSINIGTGYAVVLSRDAPSRVRPLPASWRRCTLLVIGIGIFARSIATNVTVSCLQTPPFGILAA